MTRERRGAVPRTFFLNEQHELAHREKEGGGGMPKLAPLDWAAKGRRIQKTLTAARQTVLASRDPLREARFFIAAIPSKTVVKESKNSRRAPDGTFEHVPAYAGEDSRTFRRLGLDLLGVDAGGRALVHASADRIEQLVLTSAALSSEGLRERARWVTIDAFEPAPSSFRVDESWLTSLERSKTFDTVVELQPLLSRVEVEQVVRAIIEILGPSARDERFNRMGTDFSGRHWYRGALSRESLKLIAETFYSVSSIHPPLKTAIACAARRAPGGRSPSAPAVPPNVSSLPTVAIVDTGVPSGHPLLAPYRTGAYVNPDGPAPYLGDHGSLVASRAVFGDQDMSGGVTNPTGDCAFVDVSIAESVDEIDDKALFPAINAVLGTYPNVRVFNLSFGDYRPLSAYDDIARREKLILLRDLDNLVFARDIIVVVSAGNSKEGVVPNPSYPDHMDVPEWALGSWASGFNTLKCGSLVEQLTPGGLVKNAGWPSPFTRVGPGLCGAPVPEFGAHGGNCVKARPH